MSETDALYAELKPDIGAVAEKLFAMSELFIRKHGNFLPHGAILKTSDEVAFIAAAPHTGSDLVSSVDVLPLLHEGLRAQAKENDLKAIGVAENVTVALEEQVPIAAIKVLIEHKRGLTVALYLPFRKKLFKGYAFGSSFAKVTESEVRPWA